MENDQQISRLRSNRSSLISITNWDDYQHSNQQDSQQTANRPPTERQQTATNNNVLHDTNVLNENKSAVKSVDLPTDFDDYVTKFYNEYIMTHYPRSTTKIENERKAVRLLLNKDYNSLSDYHDVLKFLQDDSFWRGNIQSINKLTKIKDGVRYFDKILTKSRELRFTTDKGKTNSQRQTTDISRIKTI